MWTAVVGLRSGNHTHILHTMPRDNQVRIETMIEMMYALHLSAYVEGPFKDRGGMMLVGPPGVLKTSILNVLERSYPNVVTLSDANSQMLVELRGQIAQEAIRTLVIPELAKLYERDPRVAANVEGTLRALAAEGFRAASFEDARVNRIEARCLVIGALTEHLHSVRFAGWEHSGFNRRFLWPVVTLNAEVLDRAVHRWEYLLLDRGQVPPIPAEQIPQRTTDEERHALRLMVKHQPGGTHAQQFALMVKLLAVLQWWYPRIGRTREDAFLRMHEFAASLGKNGAEIIIPTNGRPKRRAVAKPSRRRKRK